MSPQDVIETSRPIFVHAWWRSGSTYVWSKLRENQTCVCFYEPLHEKLLARVRGQVEPSLDSEISTTLRHPALTKSYFGEYRDLFGSNDFGFAQELSYDRFFLLPEQEDEKLRVYLAALIDAASASGRKAVLCFCRSQMRSAWIKIAFGGLHVAQIRNPAHQWASFQVEPYFRTKMLVIALKLRDAYPRSFAHIENFERFALFVAKRPSFPFEQFISSFVNERDALEIFLLIWVWSAAQAVSHADFVLDIDALSRDEHSRQVASEWFGKLGCSVGFSDCAIPEHTPSRETVDFDLSLADVVKAVRAEGLPHTPINRAALDARLSALSSLSRNVLRSVLAL